GAETPRIELLARDAIGAVMSAGDFSTKIIIGYRLRGARPLHRLRELLVRNMAVMCRIVTYQNSLMETYPSSLKCHRFDSLFSSGCVEPATLLVFASRLTER